MRALLMTLLTAPLFAFGQFIDDFSDGNHSTNPTWHDSMNVFEIDQQSRLWLNAPPINATAAIVTGSRAIKNASWAGTVTFDFNPSASNMAFIYLCSNSSNLQDTLNGYYLRIGGTNDEISLWRQKGSSHIQIIDGIDDLLDFNNVTIRFLVNRSNGGYWSLYADTGNQTPTTLQGTAVDDLITESRFFGIRCQYTSTRSTGFYFDDFIVTGSAYPDTIDPKIKSIIVTDSNNISLRFTEPVLAPPLSNINFSLYPDQGQVLSPSFTSTWHDEIVINLSSPLQEGLPYRFYANNLVDTAGNIGSDSVSINYFNPKKPGFKGLQFNEIFADPSPQVGLPDAEFIEIQNLTDHYVDLKGLSISDLLSASTNTKSIMLAPGALALLCDVADTSLFKATNALIVPFNGMPGLNNNSESLWLRHDSTLLDFISYTDAWYHTPDKKDGGYSLERINPRRPCHDTSNWKASEDPNGGTPGKPNSILNDSQDKHPPKILSAYWLDSNQLKLQTNEALDTGLISMSSIARSDGGGVASIAFDLNQQAITIHWDSPVKAGTGYEVTINHITDCSGNQGDTIIETALGAHPKPFDLIINEIYTKPVSTGLPPFEFIEIYNRSSSVISTNGVDFKDKVSNASLPDVLIWPEEHIILCDDDGLEDYKGFGSLITVSSMPALNDADDHLQLIFNDTIVLDEVAYDSDYFHPDRPSNAGWSLERISYNRLCYGRQNWSSSKDRKGGTPGTRNSIWNEIPAQPPKLQDVIFADKSIVILKFNQRLKALSEYDLAINGQTQKLYSNGKEQDTIVLIDTLKRGVEHVFEATKLNACDNKLNVTNRITRYLWKKGDIIINEILFNPRGEASDHVELLNRSEHSINLMGWSLPSMNKDSTWQQHLISDTAYYLTSGAHVAITEDVKSTIQNYPFAQASNLIERELPVYANSNGIVWLLDAWNHIMDNLEYHEDMHFPLITNPDGVALERVTRDQSMDNQTVLWQSASSTDNYGTPGYLNSQNILETSSEEEIWLSTKTISPNNDGYQDNVLIYYNLQKPGQMLSIDIYNDDGLFINQLVSNELVGTSGAKLWVGLSEGGSTLNTGIYIIVVRVFDMNQGEKRFKLPIVLNVGR